MSQLKKQTIAARKQARRSSTTTAKSDGSAVHFRSVVASTWRASARLASLIAKPCLSAAKKWPKFFLVVGLSLLTITAAGYGASRVVGSIRQALPESFEVNTPRADLLESISRISRETIATARNERWNRTTLTDKLLSRISLVDGVDEVSLRAGLDGKLRIEVAAQAPMLIIEGKGSERILVGSKFKIISRSVGTSEYPQLPVLEATDLPLNVNSNREKRRTQTGVFVRPASVSSANIRWLSQQTLRIHGLFASDKLNTELEKINWRAGTGFSVVLKHKDHRPAQVENSSQTAIAVPASAQQSLQMVEAPAAPLLTTVILGEGQLNEKYERLVQVMQDLRLKKNAVEQIDLGYADKAIIRMSENLSEAKRGGIQ
jgi:hypothetical protein